MLIFFIHGVATRTNTYSKELQEAIVEGLQRHTQGPAYFQSGFWGDIKNSVDDGTIWNYINSDLNDLEQQVNTSNASDLFRYKDVRKNLISPFTIDLLSYLNPQKGRAIRQKIADQLAELISEHSNEKELHIICHSLGTVILWDCLFQTNFDLDDPAFQIRKLFQNNQQELDSEQNVVSLKSVVTMGSPILFVNTMLGISNQDIRHSLDKYTQSQLKWLNIIHASDIIAYPLKASLDIDDSWNLDFRDMYISSNDTFLLSQSTVIDFAERAARKLGNDIAAMALSTSHAHESYWSDKQVHQAIITQVIRAERNQATKKSPDNHDKSFITSAFEYLQRVKGLKKAAFQSYREGELTNLLTFVDGSGTLHHTINFARVHHVHFLTSNGKWLFSGYVDWKHTSDLRKALEYIKIHFC